MYKSIELKIESSSIVLLPEKVIYWPEKKMIILSDIHLGKSGHFRKSGIAAPAVMNSKNLERLSLLIKDYNPEIICVLGDLFHSDVNREWIEFEKWRNQFQNLHFKLILGNHDTLHKSFYNAADIEVAEYSILEPFIFTHQADKKIGHFPSLVRISGHIHPAVRLSGKGKQSLRIPCFKVSRNEILLPAFGEFTGLHTIKPDETDRVFGVVEDSVFELKPRIL
jgi:uncharacterized protein